MSALLNRNSKHSDSFVDHSVASMHFWGICCESGKRYAQVVGQRFRITMAVLDPKSFCKEDKIVSLVVIRDGIEYLLCVLKHGELHQVNLNLIFDRGENVIFYINGYGKVYLSGYQLSESGADALTDENGYLCPLVEVKSKGKKEKGVGNVEPEASTSKSNKKMAKGQFEDGDSAYWRKKLVLPTENGDDDDDDEADSDFSASDALESKSDESESEEMDDNLSEVDPEEEIDLDDLNEEEKKIIMGAHKRKRRSALRAQKRAKNDSMSSSDSVENEDIICIEDKDSDPPVLAVNCEPSSGEKKKKKKKKKLTEISQIAETVEVNETATPSNKNAKVKNPVQKLQGGLEIQDVIVGRGPVATKGKIAHVFYVGRLENKSIFDARSHGKKPFSFKLGVGQVIKGWDIGLQGMKVGGQRKLKVPPNMGYGSSHVDGIPPNSTLYFSVELQNVN